MTAEQGTAFLTALGAKNINVKGNGWIEASCPLAKWLHKHHTDSTPSFGITIAPGERSYFLCFACRQGSAEELLHTIQMYDKGQGHYDFLRCHQILMDEQYVVPLPEYGVGHTGPVFVEWPNWWQESFSKVDWIIEAMSYLTWRGVTPTTIKHYDLRYDSKRQMIVAPYRDVFNRLAGARGRSILDPAPQKHYDYTFQNVNNARLVWYNEPVLNLSGPVVVVEGQFDVFKVWQVFPKVIAALTAKPTFEKMKKLGDCERVIQIPDRDEAGEQSVERYAKHCHQLGLRHEVVYLDEGCKDAGDCHPEYLKDKIYELL